VILNLAVRALGVMVVSDCHISSLQSTQVIPRETRCYPYPRPFVVSMQSLINVPASGEITVSLMQRRRRNVDCIGLTGSLDSSLRISDSAAIGCDQNKQSSIEPTQ
jgi:hypothetical protein